MGDLTTWESIYNSCNIYKMKGADDKSSCLLCSAKQYQRKDEHCLPSRYPLIVSKMKINHQKEAGKPTLKIL